MAIGTFTRPAVTPATFDVVAVLGGGELDSVAILTAGDGYMVGDVLDTFTGSVGGTGGQLTVGSVVGGAVYGPIASIGISAIGATYLDTETLTDASTLTALGGDYLGHDEYEAGGALTEYTDATQSSYKPAIPPNTLGTDQVLVKTVLKADQPQLAVQKRYIDGGAVEVFAEPTTVNSKGKVVGNVLRAEDITDEARCTAAGFNWVPNAATGDADQGVYGYCEDDTYTPQASAAAVNALDEALFDREFECRASGFHWETSESGVDTQCLDATTAGTFSFANFVDTVTGINYATTSSAQQYAKAKCTQFGHQWNPTLMTCIADTTPVGNEIKSVCEDAGHVWIAGVCYDGSDFGDGQNRDASFQQDPTDEPV